MRLRHFLTAVFTVVSIVPAAFIGYWVYDTALENEMAAVQEKHLLLARNITAALERYAQDSTAVFRAYVAQTDARQPTKTLDGILESFEFRALTIFAPSGRESLLTAIGGDAAGDSLPSPDGVRRLIESAGPNPVFSPVAPDSTGRPTIYLTLRLADGRVALGALDTGYIIRLQKAIAFGRKGHSAIVDHTGTVIAHPRAEWQRSMRSLAKVIPVRRMMAGETGVTEFYSPAIKKDMVSGFTVTPGAGWGVMVPQPLEELEERAESVLIVALLIALGGLVITSVIIWLLTGKIIKPVSDVLRATSRIGRGRSDARVVPGGRFLPREFRWLSLGFNRMADRLEEDQRIMAQALDQAQLANKAKSEFLANISHELRTPLNAVIGFSETMAMELHGPLGSPRYREYVEDVRESGTHLLGVINDILDLARIDAGKMEIVDDKVDIAATVRAMVAMVADGAKDAGIVLEQEVPQDMPVFCGSEGKLKQILVKLLSNAVKFTPVGGKITVTGARMPDGGIALTVADTGIGMTEDGIARALQPFGQVDSSLERKYEGVGLGLPLTKSLTELHDGTLEVISTLGEGTQITVRFPAHRVLETRSDSGAVDAKLSFPDLRPVVASG